MSLETESDVLFMLAVASSCTAGRLKADTSVIFSNVAAGSRQRQKQSFESLSWAECIGTEGGANEAAGPDLDVYDDAFSANIAVDAVLHAAAAKARTQTAEDH